MASSIVLDIDRIEAATRMATIGKTRRPVAREARGVLHALAAGEFAHHREAPPPGLADWVEHFWRVRWNLDGLPPQVQETLPHPNVHLVVEPGSARAFGVHTRRWTRVLEGCSSAFGIKFRPGAFRAFLQGPVSRLMDDSLPAEALFGSRAHELLDLAACADDAGGDAHAVDLAARFLLGRLPAVDPDALLAGRIVDSIVDDRELHAAAALAERFGLSLRALQRLFNDYVGVGPKWVINRYRIHDAVARVQAGRPVAWAMLAQDLGYFDQAHFITDFRKLVGKTPADYAREQDAARLR
jgi:AraC-like DNA-binding protein